MIQTWKRHIKEQITAADPLKKKANMSWEAE